MKRLFDNILERSYEERILARYSYRFLFLFLLLYAFALGACFFGALVGGSGVHVGDLCFAAAMFAVVWREIRIVYRRLCQVDDSEAKTEFDHE